MIYGLSETTRANTNIQSPSPSPQATLAPDGSFQDFIFINLMWFSVSLALVLLVGFWRPYFGRMRFEMSYW